MSLGDLTTLFTGDSAEERKKNLMLLGEIDSLLRALPSLESFAGYSDDSTQWRGKAKAVLRAWDSVQAIELAAAFSSIDSSLTKYKQTGFAKLKALLHQARFDLQMTTGEGINSAYDTGSVFSYFDDARKLFEQAVTDMFVIDPWLDADFVSRYLPGVKTVFRLDC